MVMTLPEKVVEDANAKHPLVTERGMQAAWDRFGKHALIMSYVKDDERLYRYAGELAGNGWTLWASGGTHSALLKEGIQARNLSEITGREAILGHKVVSLSAEKSVATLANPMLEEELTAVETARLPFITLGAVICYPISAVLPADNANLSVAKFLMDIGGPTALRELVKAERIPIWSLDVWDKVQPWIREGMPNYGKAVLDLAVGCLKYTSDYDIKCSRAHERFRTDYMNPVIDVKELSKA